MNIYEIERLNNKLTGHFGLSRDMCLGMKVMIGDKEWEIYRVSRKEITLIKYMKHPSDPTRKCGITRTLHQNKFNIASHNCC